MSNGNGSLPLGDIAFFDRVLPLLDAGDYTIVATQQVDSTDAAHPLSKRFPATQSVSVVAPRFALPAEDVQSFFPPNNANGIFDQNLPHVVLTQRVLPWERTLAPSDVPPNTPWMALLLLTDDEIIPPAGTPQGSTIANPTMAGSYSVAQLLNPPDPSTLGPNVTPQAEDETSCRAIDITTATFTAVTPRLAELQYLAHGRQVNPADKTTALASGDGWFSVVIGNRFPATDPTLNGGKRNIVHLVSLEGFSMYLVDNPTWPAGKTKVRLASLASWSFTCKSEGGSFRQIMLALTAGQPKGGDTLRLQLPVTGAAQPPSSPAAMAQAALQQGFAALGYDTRVGDHTFAWYHGPFVPHPLAGISGTPFSNSAAATIYDQTTGTFGLSYAVAWEVGRMLALSDRAYAANQMSARRALRKVVNLVRERTRSGGGASLLADANSSDPAVLGALLESRHVSKSFVSWLGEAAAGHLPRPGLAARAPQPHDAATFRAAQPAAVTHVRTLMARNDVHSLLAHETAKAMQSGPMAAVVSWLGNLRLLSGVPFVHLLADARMLPAESIRFFYVDNNYLDALCDGASSVGVQTSRDAAQQQAVRGTLRNGAMLHARVARAKAIGREHLLQAPQPNDPIAGFILRSEVVSGWPGLEVKAFENADGVTGPIDIVRMDHLAPDVLLVLFAKTPAWIEIDEPREGLAFGVEDDNTVELRSLSGPDIGKVIVGKSVTLSSDYMRGARVVNIDAWQAYLAGQMGSPPSWGPATFAIEMVRAPEQMIFQNQPDGERAAAKEVSRG
jgi:hypothetical protein